MRCLVGVHVSSSEVSISSGHRRMLCQMLENERMYSGVLVRVLIAVKRHHDRGNSYNMEIFD